jgi:MFS family permease
MSTPQEPTPARASRRGKRRMLAAVSLVAFATALFARAVDPIVPPIARDLVADPASVALLSTAFAIPYALIQPVLGPMADKFGKIRVIRVCLSILILTGFLAAASTSFALLLGARMISGMAAGGVFPVSLALIGDLVPVAERQIALGRYLVMVISGNFLGAALAGAMADVVGWRGVFAAVASCGVMALAAAQVGFKNPRAAGLVRNRASARELGGNPRQSEGANMLRGGLLRGRGSSRLISLHRPLDVCRWRDPSHNCRAGAKRVCARRGGLLAVRAAVLRNFSQALLMAVGSAIAALALLGLGLGASWQVLMPVFAVMGVRTVVEKYSLA